MAGSAPEEGGGSGSERPGEPVASPPLSWSPAPNWYTSPPPAPPPPPPPDPLFSLQVTTEEKGETGKPGLVSRSSLACYLANSTDLCSTGIVSLDFEGVPASLSEEGLEWAIVYEDVLLSVTPHRGTIPEGTSKVSLAIDVQEQHAPSGRHYLDLVVVTNQAECVGWGKAGTRFGEDWNLRGLEESFLRGRRPCPAAAFAYSLSAVLDSGLLIIPAVHEVQVPYDTQVNLASNLVYVEDVPSGTEAKVEVSVTSCAGALELKAEQGDFDGVRKHVPQPADFVVKGDSGVFSDFSGKSSFECWLTFSHTGAKGQVKSESILVEVTPAPGAPSRLSELRKAVMNSRGGVVIPVTPKDALGNDCDTQWEEYAFKVWAFHGEPLSVLELGTTEAYKGSGHALILEIVPEELDAGVYDTRAALVDAEDGRIVQHLGNTGALTIPPVACLPKGKRPGLGIGSVYVPLGSEGTPRGRGGKCSCQPPRGTTSARWGPSRRRQRTQIVFRVPMAALQCLLGRPQ